MTLDSAGMPLTLKGLGLAGVFRPAPEPVRRKGLPRLGAGLGVGITESFHHQHAHAVGRSPTRNAINPISVPSSLPLAKDYPCQLSQKYRWGSERLRYEMLSLLAG